MGLGFLYINLRVIWEKGVLTEEFPSSERPIGKSTDPVFDGCWRTQPIVGGVTPGCVVLNCVRKTVEQAKDSKPESSILPGFCL